MAFGTPVRDPSSYVNTDDIMQDHARSHLVSALALLGLRDEAAVAATITRDRIMPMVQKMFKSDRPMMVGMLKDRKSIRFTVQGGGEFPLDMLRRDECWPINGDEVKNLVGTGRRVINLESVARHGPTIERWESFGWKIINVDGQTVVD